VTPARSTAPSSTAPSRRGSADWARFAAPGPVDVDVLVPTIGRPAELAVTLAGLAAQDAPRFRVVIADQSYGDGVGAAPAVAAMLRVLEAQARPVALHRRAVRHGVAEQRQYLLDAATAPYVLFLDDDVWLEPGALSRMFEAISALGCGFVGQAVQGLSYLADERPGEQAGFEPWTGGVGPETVRTGTTSFDRWPLHNAANLAHLAARLELAPGEWRPYRVAWIGGCVMYDRETLIAAGGFDFWPQLGATHVGEDVAAQWRVMELAGGAGILPSGAVHLEAPTTITDRRVNATDLLFSSADDGLG
jgi:GT2 family glycosyltransferase